MEAGSRVHTAWHCTAGQPIHQDTSGGRSLLRGRVRRRGFRVSHGRPDDRGPVSPGPCPRRKLALEIQACRHHTSGPPPRHSMIGESATSISSLPAQPARRMISAQPLRLPAAHGLPVHAHLASLPLGERANDHGTFGHSASVARSHTPASGRSPRCLTGRCAVPGGVLVRLNARTKVALDTFTQAAEGGRDLINAARARGTSGKAGHTLRADRPVNGSGRRYAALDADHSRPAKREVGPATGRP